MRSSIPTQYQGMQGQMYANYQTPQKLGEQLTPFGVRPGQALPPAQTGGIGTISTPLTPPVGDETPINVDQGTLDDIVAEVRQDLDMPVIGSYEDLVPKPTPKPITGNVGKQRKIRQENKEALEKWEEGKRQFEEATGQFRYGKIASLSEGGMPGGMDLYGGEEEKPSLGGIGGLASLTKEQLIALLKSKGISDLGQSSSPGPITPLQQGKNFGQGMREGIQSIGKLLGIGAASGGLMSLAAGGDVDFPRMNGPISDQH